MTFTLGDLWDVLWSSLILCHCYVLSLFLISLYVCDRYDTCVHPV